jgi:copper chaperone CopZ
MNLKRLCVPILILSRLSVLQFEGGRQGAMASPAPQISETLSKQKTVQMRIAGMTCAACAKGLEASFRHMAGVVKASIDYKAGQAVITFDPAKQSNDKLAKFVTGCGYQVKDIKVI